MTFARSRVVSSVLAGLLAAGSVASGQTPPGREITAASVASYGLAQQMPVDPEVAVGTLPNGLRYYVRANAKPARRAELRLVVKAGSVLEDEDQQGLAHFVEHMEFEGTKHFPKQSLVDFLSSLGLSIGADANAATSFDDTQYTLRVPTDVPGALDRALLVLEDWAQAATFDQAGIDRERGIVLSEWRMNLGAGERTADKIRRVQLEGSRYADRPPIGKPEIIEKAPREALTRFYHDWYRPDLMAVIVAGDVDRDRVVGMIKDHFSALKSPSPERPRQAFDVPDKPGTRYAVVSDKESTATVVELSNLRPARNQGSVGGYRAITLDQLFGAMLGSRLDELSQRENPPFIQANADRSLFPMPRTKDRIRHAGAGRERRRIARPRCARDRARAGREVRLHRDRARSRQAGDDGRLRARGHGEPGPRVREPRRRIHPQLPPGRSAADDLAGARVPPPVRARDHAGRDERAHQRLVPRSEPPRGGCRAGRDRRRPARRSAAGGRRQDRRREEARGLRGRRGRAGVDDGAAGARDDRQDHAASRPGSPSGRSRTA